jgi:Mrp family chromosome partitioning ATPase/capsular polysaccharide biosynthesis protein
MFVRDPVYEATAKFYVRVGMDQTPSPLLGERGVTFLAQARGAVQSEVDMLRNEVLIQRLIEQLNLASPAPKTSPATFVQYVKQFIREALSSMRGLVDPILAFLNLKTILTPDEEVRSQLSQSILAESTTNSDVIAVTLWWPDKSAAVHLLRTFVNLYLGFRATVFEDHQEFAFLESSRDDLKKAVEDIEAEIASIEQRYDVRNASNRAQLTEAERATITIWKSLERRREIADKRYQQAEKRLSEARDISALQKARLSNVVLVQPPIASALPVGMRNMTLFEIIASVSIVVACGWALVREVFDSRLHHAGRAARLLGLTLLGDLPESEALAAEVGEPKAQIRDWLAKVFRRSPLNAMLGIYHSALSRCGYRAMRFLRIVNEPGGLQAAKDDRSVGDPRGGCSDLLSVARLAAAVGKFITEKNGTLAIVGAASAEGATTVSLALSKALADKGWRVLLVQAGGAVRPNPHGLPIGDAGLNATLPAGLRCVALADKLECLAFDEGLGKEAQRALFDIVFGRTLPLVDNFEVILVDLPPVLESADSAVAAGQSDGVLLVAAAARSAASMHQRAMDELRLHNGAIIGLVFNRRRDRVPSWLIQQPR